MALMKLIDGREVSIESPEWRHECEARYAVKRPTLQERRQYLAEVERSRGKTAADHLRDTMSKIWEAER